MPIILLSLMAACATSFAALIVFDAQKVRRQTFRICCPFSVSDLIKVKDAPIPVICRGLVKNLYVLVYSVFHQSI
jgi:hypothetical protein